jgi:hypothetical protein
MAREQKNQNYEKMCLKRVRAQEEGTRVNGDGRILASSSPWFIGVDKNLVARK